MFSQSNLPLFRIIVLCLTLVVAGMATGEDLWFPYLAAAMGNSYTVNSLLGVSSQPSFYQMYVNGENGHVMVNLSAPNVIWNVGRFFYNNPDHNRVESYFQCGGKYEHVGEAAVEWEVGEPPALVHRRVEVNITNPGETQCPVKLYLYASDGTPLNELSRWQWHSQAQAPLLIETTGVADDIEWNDSEDCFDAVVPAFSTINLYLAWGPGPEKYNQLFQDPILGDARYGSCTAGSTMRLSSMYSIYASMTLSSVNYWRVARGYSSSAWSSGNQKWTVSYPAVPTVPAPPPGSPALETGTWEVLPYSREEFSSAADATEWGAYTVIVNPYMEGHTYEFEVLSPGENGKNFSIQLDSHEMFGFIPSQWAESESQNEYLIRVRDPNGFPPPAVAVSMAYDKNGGDCPNHTLNDPIGDGIQSRIVSMKVDKFFRE